MRYYLIFFLFLIGCGPHVAFKMKDERLTPFIQKFENYYGVKYRGSYTLIKEWYPKNDSRLAYCYMNEIVENSNHNAIFVKEEYWNKATEISREQLMFHELGHCALKLNHDDTMMGEDPKCAVSLMHSYHQSDECYIKYKDYYLEEMIK